MILRTSESGLTPERGELGPERKKNSAIKREPSQAAGDFKAVDDVSLEVEKREIYGFLGPNEAGKITTILMLLGILKPTKRRIYLFDEELTGASFELKKKIGVVSQKQYLYREMTAGEYLDFFAHLYEVKDGAKRIDALLDHLKLLDVKNRKLGAFSRGMQ